jgi:hypothetical protein
MARKGQQSFTVSKINAVGYKLTKQGQASPSLFVPFFHRATQKTTAGER